MAKSFLPADRIKAFSAPTVWHMFTPLAQKCKAVNLGQGFPGWAPPKFVQEACVDAVRQTGPNYNYMVNQYARSAGDLRLVTFLADKYAKSLSRDVSPLTDVLVTNGCTEAFFCVTQGLLNPGDEVIMFEPAFDIYMATVEMAGATTRTVPLTPTPTPADPNAWGFDAKALEALFNDKTRMMIINTPHNPTGKVFSAVELQTIADLVLRFPNVVCVADEVYEQLTFDGHEHRSIAALPGMWERTLTLSSVGKTFSVTGWKIGWAVGPAALVRCAAIAHQWVCFSVNTPAQVAIASALNTAEKPYETFDTYYDWLRAEYARKREIMVAAVRAAGMSAYVPQGAFYIVCNTSSLRIPEAYAVANKDLPHDWLVCKWFTEVIGVAAIPPSSFYSKGNSYLAKDFARFAFCKPDQELEQAAQRLLKLRTFAAKPKSLL